MAVAAAAAAQPQSSVHVQPSVLVQPAAGKQPAGPAASVLVPPSALETSVHETGDGGNGATGSKDGPGKPVGELSFAELRRRRAAKRPAVDDGRPMELETETGTD